MLLTPTLSEVGEVIKSLSIRHSKPKTLGQVMGQRSGFQTNPGEPDVAVGTQ